MSAPSPSCDHRYAHFSTNGDGVAFMDCECGERGPVRRITAMELAQSGVSFTRCEMCAKPLNEGRARYCFACRARRRKMANDARKSA